MRRRDTILGYNDLIFEDQASAWAALDSMTDICDHYGIVTVSDLYDIANCVEPYTAHKYGWTRNLIDNASIDRSRFGYKITLPTPIRIDDYQPYDEGFSGSDFDGDFAAPAPDLNMPIIVDEENYSEDDMDLLKELFNIPDEATEIRINNIAVDYSVPKKEVIQEIIDQIHDNDVEKEVFEYLSGWLMSVVDNLEEEIKILEGEY